MEVDKQAPFDGIHLVDRPWFPYLCTEVENWEWSSSGEEHSNLWICMGGAGYLRVDDQGFRIRPGAFFIFSPSMRVFAFQYSGERVTRFSAHFHPLKSGVILENGLDFKSGQIEDLERMRKSLDATMRLAFRRENETVLNARLFDLITELLGEQRASYSNIDPRLSKAVDLMRTDPAGDWTMKELAKEVGLSRSHFDREFSNQIGQPPRQFLVGCRMVEAQRGLEASRERIGELAERLGYRDVYFFSRQFKQHFGVSPSEYRKAYGSNSTVSP